MKLLSMARTLLSMADTWQSQHVHRKRNPITLSRTGPGTSVQRSWCSYKGHSARGQARTRAAVLFSWLRRRDMGMERCSLFFSLALLI
jgi:hypothetical protein